MTKLYLIASTAYSCAQGCWYACIIHHLYKTVSQTGVLNTSYFPHILTLASPLSHSFVSRRASFIHW